VASRVRFVAMVDERVVGMAGIGPSTVSRAADITSVWVDPQVRGKGVGDSMMLAAFTWAREGGYSQVLLWVAEGNAHAERLYQRHGFSRTGATQQVRPGEDRLEFEMSARIS
jgi:ribosomal protein S18 acetylase RimI-like enzyme